MSCAGEMGYDSCVGLGSSSSDKNIEVLELYKSPQPCVADMGKPDRQWQEYLDFKRETNG
jgi:hypothetical protein